MTDKSTSLEKRDNEKLTITKGQVTKLVDFAVQQTAQKLQKLGGGSGGGSRTPAELEFWGGMIKHAGLIPQNKSEPDAVLEARAMAKIVAGDTYGFNPIESQGLIHFLPMSGSFKLDYKARLAIIRKSKKYDYKIIELTDKLATVEIVTSKGSVGSVTYTIEEAKTAKLTDKDVWRKFTKDMLLSKAAHRAFNRLTPDLMREDMVFDDTEIEDVISTSIAPQLSETGVEEDESQDFFNESQDSKRAQLIELAAVKCDSPDELHTLLGVEHIADLKNSDIDEAINKLKSA